MEKRTHQFLPCPVYLFLLGFVVSLFLSFIYLQRCWAYAIAPVLLMMLIFFFTTGPRWLAIRWTLLFYSMYLGNGVWDLHIHPTGLSCARALFQQGNSSLKSNPKRLDSALARQVIAEFAATCVQMDETLNHRQFRYLHISTHLPLPVPLLRKWGWQVKVYRNPIKWLSTMITLLAKGRLSLGRWKTAGKPARRKRSLWSHRVCVVSRADLTVKLPLLRRRASQPTPLATR